MKEIVERWFEESIKTKKETLEANVDVIVRIAREIIKALEKKKKVIFFGNGGSAADSQHIAAEFIGRFRRERKSLPAIALTTDTSVITALGNDYGFDIIFARQLEGLANRGDIAVALSTSGNSKNVIEGVRQAKKMGLTTVALTGNKGGRLVKISDINLIVPSSHTARIQEAHISCAHAICELVESYFYKKKK